MHARQAVTGQWHALNCIGGAARRHGTGGVPAGIRTPPRTHPVMLLAVHVNLGQTALHLAGQSGHQTTVFEAHVAEPGRAVRQADLAEKGGGGVWRAMGRDPGGERGPGSHAKKGAGCRLSVSPPLVRHLAGRLRPRPGATGGSRPRPWRSPPRCHLALRVQLPRHEYQRAGQTGWGRRSILARATVAGDGFQHQGSVPVLTCRHALAGRGRGGCTHWHLLCRIDNYEFHEMDVCC